MRLVEMDGGLRIYNITWVEGKRKKKRVVLVGRTEIKYNEKSYNAPK